MQVINVYTIGNTIVAVCTYDQVNGTRDLCTVVINKDHFIITYGQAPSINLAVWVYSGWDPFMPTATIPCITNYLNEIMANTIGFAIDHVLQGGL